MTPLSPTFVYAAIRRLHDAGLFDFGKGMALSTAIEVVAREHLGRGEGPANNRGDYLDDIGAGDGAAWCAAFGSTVIREAWSRVFTAPCPIEHDLGAKSLWRQCARHGHVIKGRDVEPGDLVCWDRGDLGDWRGHFGVVVDPTAPDDGVFKSIEGNVGAYPALVSELTRRFDNPRLIGFARIIPGK